MTWLKQSTASTLVLGPFVDSVDGSTAETALTLSQADIRLSKNGAAFAQTNNSAGATHMENGYYSVPLDTTDTNTLGRLRVAVNESGALPVYRDFMVVPANVWDSLFGADKLQVHVDEMTAGIITAAVIATDAIDNDALAAEAVTEIQSGLATQASVDDLPTNAELTTALGTSDDATLAAIAALNNISVANVLAGVVEGSITLQGALRLMLAILSGRSTGGGTVTVNFRDVANAKNRVQATVDSSGNRSAVTLDITD